MSAVRRWAIRFIFACIFMALLYLLGHHAGSMPPVLIALLWAALSVGSATLLTYHSVVRKTLKQHAYNEQGVLSRLNNGRILRLFIWFVVSAVCMGSLIVEAPTWDTTEWIVVFATVPVYPAVFLCMERRLGKEFSSEFKVSKTANWSCIIVTALAVAAYGIVSLVVQSDEVFDSAADAFLSVEQPFENSPSALMSTIGMLSALADGFTAYSISRASEFSAIGHAAVKGFLVISAFYSITTLLSLCFLSKAELKRVFLPLESAISPCAKPHTMKKVVVVTVALPVLLMGLFLVADHQTAKASQTEEGTAVKNFIRDQIDLTVYLLDGTYYKYQAVQDLYNETALESAALAQEAQETLVPLINASYDTCLTNVDAYLDWYYSLPADYERLVNTITGSVEDYVEEQFVEKIGAGVDNTGLESQFQYYSNRAEELEQDYRARLAEYEVTDVPEWLLTVNEEIEADFLPEGIGPSRQFLSAGERGLVSGLAAGIGTKTVAKMGAKGLGKVAGRAVSVIGGPVGFVVGTLGIDYGMLKLDELSNREAYKAEIIQTIEDNRAQKLAEVQKAFAAT